MNQNNPLPARPSDDPPGDPTGDHSGGQGNGEQPQPPVRPRVAVIFGGRSGEHAISVVTAANVLDAIDSERYDVLPIGIAPDGRWVLDRAVTGRRAIESGADLPHVDDSAAPVLLGNSRRLLVTEPGQVPDELGAVDVVFPLLHGPYGEDGTLQGLLELADVRFVGSGVLSSALAMDKQYTKVVLGAAGLEMTGWLCLPAADWVRANSACRERVAALGYPVFVKPARAGSSLGISRVANPDELDAAVEQARRHDPKVLVEKVVGRAREVECGVLESIDDGAPEVSVCAEITVRGGEEAFYDFDTKYLPEAAERVAITVPADLPAAVEMEIRTMAVTAFQALNCEGLARVDFFITEDDQVLISEVNTMPGFTPTSVFPRVWQASGIDFPMLVDRLIQLALRREVGLR